MRSLSEKRDEPSPLEIVTAGLVTIGFVVGLVVFGKVAYTAVALLIHGAAYAVQVALY